MPDEDAQAAEVTREAEHAALMRATINWQVSLLFELVQASVLTKAAAMHIMERAAMEMDEKDVPLKVRIAVRCAMSGLDEALDVPLSTLHRRRAMKRQAPPET